MISAQSFIFFLFQINSEHQRQTAHFQSQLFITPQSSHTPMQVTFTATLRCLARTASSTQSAAWIQFQLKQQTQSSEPWMVQHYGLLYNWWYQSIKLNEFHKNINNEG